MAEKLANRRKLRRNTFVAGLLSVIAMLGAPSSARAGPPFRTDDPEPVDYQHWEIDAFSTATREVKGDTAGMLPSIESQLRCRAEPAAPRHRSAWPSTRQAEVARKFGYGDTELGAKYRFIEEDEDGWRPQVGVFPLLEAPTGNAQRGLGAGHAREFLPLWLQKSFGAWMTYGGGGYWRHDPE